MRLFRRKPPVVDVRRLNIEPGDALLVTVPSKLSAAEAERIRAAFRDNLDGVKVLVVSEGMNVSVIPGAQQSTRSRMPDADAMTRL